MQNYKNHAKFVPLYHFVTFPIIMANAIYALIQLKHGVTLPSGMFAATSVALVLLTFLARFFALRVQDRVIRLEMRLRLRDVLPAPMHGDIARLSISQMVGLRFASDAELPSLVTAALKDNLSGNDIKKLVKDWQADNDRA
jgi:hypothetical protein